MRLAAYAGASSVLAAGVVLKAFHERPNFYSASVYLSQSNACRMILFNLLLLITYGLMRGLQKVIYGPLRAIEREQLWDKAWYAVTETALAMTTFRDEVGTWFFVMFVGLLAGKVWQWISEARVEALEQQPPTNPRLFHARLITSLVISEAFDILMLRYCVNALLEQPRPGMMVMFAFEFAVLAISSTSTTAKYTLSLVENSIVKKQTKARVEERREEIRLSREQARQQAEDGTTDAATADAGAEEEIDEDDIDVPGWQEKGRWLLFLDLLTDLLKLIVYMCFFSILLMFHGIPIHIIRDVFLTARSFIKRITDFLKYRNATRDMNARYPDATAEELERDGTCIICREEMQPWQPHNHDPAQRRATRTIIDERQRPKKLPCGHVLHFGCLRSWLERQQVCPTCRSSVLAPRASQQNGNQSGQPGQNAPPGVGGAAGGAAGGNQQGPANLNINRAPRAQIAARARTFQLGNWRFTLAAGNEQQVQEALQGLREQRQQNQNQSNTTARGITEALEAISSTTSTQDQLARIERRLMRELNSLNVAQEQLGHVRTLQAELDRLRAVQANPALAGTIPTLPVLQQHQPRYGANGLSASNLPSLRTTPTGSYTGYPAPGQPGSYTQQTFNSTAALPIPAGHADLPAGFAMPEGWNMLPLQLRIPSAARPTPARYTEQNVPADAVLLQTPMSAYNATANAGAAGASNQAGNVAATQQQQQPTQSQGVPNVTDAPLPPQQQQQQQQQTEQQASAVTTQSAPQEPQLFTPQPEQLQALSSALFPGHSPAPPPRPYQTTAPAAATSTIEEDEGPISGLPNWGVSDFSAGGGAGASSVAAGPSATNGMDGTSGTSVTSAMNETNEGEATADRKGKGRATTVEDTVDEEG